MKIAPEPTPGKRRRRKHRKHRSGHHWKLWIHAVRYIRACAFLLNVRTLLLAGFACMMVYFCQSMVLDLRFRVEFSIVSVGTVFPLVFSIQQAYSRREEALRNLSMLKGVLMGTYFCHRDWDLSDGVGVRSNLGNDASPHAIESAALIMEFLSTFRVWISSRTAYESESEWRMLYGTAHLGRDLVTILVGDFFTGREDRRDKRMQELDSSSDDSSSSDDDSDRGGGDGSGGDRSMGGKCGGADSVEDKLGKEGKERAALGESGRLRRIVSRTATDLDDLSSEGFAEADPHWSLYYHLYSIVSRISVLNEGLMQKGNCAKAGEAGFSRLAAYLSRTVEVLERLRCLREYRTPFMLRYVSFILIICTVVLGAPYFAWMCVATKWEDDTTGVCPAGYITATLYVLVVSTLFHVQVSLENPFDGIGMDDVLFNLDREFAVTLRRYNKARADAVAAAAAAAKLSVDEVKAMSGGECSSDNDQRAAPALVVTTTAPAASGGAGASGASGAGGSSGGLSATQSSAALLEEIPPGVPVESEDSDGNRRGAHDRDVAGHGAGVPFGATTTAAGGDPASRDAREGPMGVRVTSSGRLNVNGGGGGGPGLVHGTGDGVKAVAIIVAEGSGDDDLPGGVDRRMGLLPAVTAGRRPPSGSMRQQEDGGRPGSASSVSRAWQAGYGTSGTMSRGL